MLEMASDFHSRLVTPEFQLSQGGELQRHSLNYSSKNPIVRCWTKKTRVQKETIDQTLTFLRFLFRSTP